MYIHIYIHTYTDTMTYKGSGMNRRTASRREATSSPTRRVQVPKYEVCAKTMIRIPDMRASRNWVSCVGSFYEGSYCLDPSGASRGPSYLEIPM